MNLKRAWLITIWVLPWATHADDYVGLSRATLSLTDHIDFYSALTNRGYQDITNALFDGKVLSKPADATLVTIFSESTVSHGATTSVVIKITDAASAQWLYFATVNATSTPPPSFDSMITMMRPRLTNHPSGKIVCATGNISHLLPENRKLALSFLQQAHDDQELVCTDNASLIDEIQLQGEVASQSNVHASDVVGRILGHDLVLLFSDAGDHVLMITAGRSIDGKKLFSMSVPDEHQFPDVFAAIKSGGSPSP